MIIHPAYDTTTKTWFVLRADHTTYTEAPTIMELLAKLPRGTKAKGYVQDRDQRELLPSVLFKDLPKPPVTKKKPVDDSPEIVKSRTARAVIRGKLRDEHGLKPGTEPIYEPPYRAPVLTGESQALYPPGKERDDIVAALWSTMSADKIAKQLRIATGSVSTILYRLRKAGDPRLTAEAGADKDSLRTSPQPARKALNGPGSPP